MGPRCSMVRYATHRRASRTNGRSNAFVGTRRARVQLPQRSAIDSLDGRSSVVTTSRAIRTSHPGDDDDAVLTDEAEPGAGRPGALEDGRVVEERSRVDRLGLGTEGADEHGELAQLFAQEHVVVLPRAYRAMSCAVGGSSASSGRAYCFATQTTLRAPARIDSPSSALRVSRFSASHCISPCMPADTNASYRRARFRAARPRAQTRRRRSRAARPRA